MNGLNALQVQQVLLNQEQLFGILQRIESDLVRIEMKVDKLERVTFNLIQNQGTLGQAISGNEGTQEKHE